MFEHLKKYYGGTVKPKAVFEKASRLMTDEAFLTATESLEQGLLYEFVNSSPEEKERREDIYRQYSLVKGVKQELARLVGSYECDNERKE